MYVRFLQKISNEYYGLKLKGSWNELKGKVKQKWGELTDDDLTYAEGQEEELIGKLQKKTGQTREEVVDYLNSL